MLKIRLVCLGWISTEATRTATDYVQSSDGNTIP